MALPNSITTTSPAGSDSPQVDNHIRALKLAIVDIFGLPDATNISVAGFSFVAGGLNVVKFQDAAGDPATAGYLQRNGTNLKFHDGTAARTLYMASGTDVAVADGGTGLSSGTSGGVLYYSAAATLASSGALTANAIVIGGGAGAAPSTVAAMTDGQLLIGSTGAAPVPASITNGGNITVTGGAGTLTLTAKDRVLIPAWGTGGAGTNYLGAGDSTTEADVTWIAPASGNFTAMYSVSSTAGSYTYTLRVNGSDTAITHSTVAATTGNSAGTVAVTAGQTVSVKQSGGANTHRITLVLELT